MLAVLAFVVAACSTDQSAPTRGIEAEAAEWKTWVLSAPDEVPLRPPPEEGSDAAAADLDELARAVSDRDPAAEAAAREWDREILLEPWLQRAMDYVSARPKDPPGASRAYGLVAVAMYDATVATWHYKRLYQRDAPEVDGALTDPGPGPSYPSEHAAIAGAASRMLAYLFPEQPAPRLERDALEAAMSRVHAGASYPSDVEAGLELGRAVADSVIAHAEADGYDREWDGTRPRGEGYWAPPPGSVALPVQPLAGRWGTWVAAPVTELRAPPPPDFGSPEFLEEALAVVEATADLTEEEERTARFWEGGEGTPLPPGIWNQVALRYVESGDLTVPQQARVFAALNVAMADAGVAAWDTKSEYWYPRPENAIRDLGIDPEWEPPLDTPFFPSYISGHATYSGAVGEVMAYLFPEDAELFRRKAEEAAWSRVLGGIHFPIDGTEGLKVGRRIGRAVVRWLEEPAG